MDRETLLEQGKNAIIDGDSDAAEASALTWLEKGFPPIELIDQSLIPGIQAVGKLWEDGEFFLPELVSGAEAMKAAMTHLEDHLEMTDESRRNVKSAIIGTVKGDIHDIGKSLVSTMLRANGFKVRDLGADVAPETFLEAFQEMGPAVICASALLTTTMTGIPDLIRCFEENGVRDRVRFMVGGAPVSREWAVEIGADGYGSNAVDAVPTAEKLAGEL